MVLMDRKLNVPIVYPYIDQIDISPQDSDSDERAE